MNYIPNIAKILFAVCGGLVGWFVGEFKPTFPLIIVAVIFIVYDAYTAYQLDKRVKENTLIRHYAVKPNLRASLSARLYAGQSQSGCG